MSLLESVARQCVYDKLTGGFPPANAILDTANQEIYYARGSFSEQLCHLHRPWM